MPTLLQINVDANNGSNGSIARDIGSIALAKGWKSYIAYGRRMLPCDSELIRVGNDWDVRLHGVLTRLFDLHGLGSILTTKKFLKRMDIIQPDIVHLHNIHGYYINYKLLFEHLQKRNIPVVWTFHDCWPFTGHCGYFTSIRCEKWKTLCHNCPQKKGYPSSFFLDRSEKAFKLKKNLFSNVEKLYITTVSHWLKSLVDESFLSDKDIRVVYNGINIDKFIYRPSILKSQYGIEDKFVLMSAAANWSNGKGWNDYISLSEKLSDDYAIMLLGVTEEQSKKLPPKIIGVKRVENMDKLAEYYSMADILLNLSHEETFGMTTAEAMACGTPGISYNVTACPEILSSETGVVVEEGNFQHIVSAIEEIRSKGKQYYSNACRKRVVENFNYKIVNQAFFDIYDDILYSK